MGSRVFAVNNPLPVNILPGAGTGYPRPAGNCMSSPAWVSGSGSPDPPSRSSVFYIGREFFIFRIPFCVHETVVPLQKRADAWRDLRRARRASRCRSEYHTSGLAGRHPPLPWYRYYRLPRCLDHYPSITRRITRTDPGDLLKASRCENPKRREQTMLTGSP